MFVNWASATRRSKMEIRDRIADKRAERGEPVSAPSRTEAGVIRKLQESLGGKGLRIWLSIVGIVFLVWLYFTPVKLADIAKWGREHWFWLIVVAGILYTLIIINATALKGAVGILKWVVVGATLLVLFLGSPLGEWLTSDKPQAASKPIGTKPLRALPQDAPDLPRAWHLDPSEWPRVQVPPHGNSVQVPNVFGGHLVWGGSGFKVHCVYSDGHEGIIGDAVHPCSDGDIIAMYAHNEGDTPVYASYAYAGKDEK